MELDNIIWIIVWAFIIVYSLVSSKNNKAKAQQRQRREPKPQAINAQPLQPHTQAAQPQATKAEPAKERLAALTGALATHAAAAATAPESSSWHSQLPTEGERVTTPAMQMSALEPEPVVEEVSWLKDKENLKKAVIFGQILQPKF